MNDAPVVESQGRAFPVETLYLGRDPNERMEAASNGRSCARSTGKRARSSSSCPVGEIERVARGARKTRDPSILVAPLYGALDRREQDRAVLPSKAGERKIVLATSVAETSLTIEGVRVVIDSGLARVPVFEPDIGPDAAGNRSRIARLGRPAARPRRTNGAGRLLSPLGGGCDGPCRHSARPEILSADLAGLVLDLAAAWGVRGRTALAFLDPPPSPAWNEAVKLLQALGALDEDGAITGGRQGDPQPAFAATAGAWCSTRVATARRDSRGLAVLVSERGLGGNAVDLADRLDRFRRNVRTARTRRAIWRGLGATGGPPSRSLATFRGALLALAYPERVAQSRGRNGEFLMANGRAASVEPHDRLAATDYVAVAEATGRAAQARILAAAAIDIAEIEMLFADRIERRNDVSFDRARAAAVAGARDAQASAHHAFGAQPADRT